MCGIVGYVGPGKVVPIILDGLRRLEYRGYDSAGVAVSGEHDGLLVRRASGKLRNLEEAIRISPVDGTYGIGHTRWATHGRPTEENAHPHRDCTGDIVVVHNGIVENFLELKQQLLAEGHRFVTETDTEVIAHLIEKHYNGGAPGGPAGGAGSEAGRPNGRDAVRSEPGGPGGAAAAVLGSRIGRQGPSGGGAAADGAASEPGGSSDAEATTRGSRAELRGPNGRGAVASGGARATDVAVQTARSAGAPKLEDAVRAAVRELSGLFALAIISRRDPNKIVAVRSGPPVVIGLGDNEYFVASDVSALLHHTRDIFFLMDGDVAVLTPEGVRLTDFEGRPVKREVKHILWDPIMAEKGGYKHFMLKEIFEQPRAVRDTTVGRVSRETGSVYLDEMDISPEEFAGFQQVKIVACGTSWHAALAGKFMVEKLARIPVEVDYGSEFRYRDPIIPPDTLTVVISQSGETADTLAAQREAKQKGSKTVAICNVVGSMVTREAAGTIYTHAGPEIGVASTKAFTCQLTALFILAMHLGLERKTLLPEVSRCLAGELLQIPAKLEDVLGGGDFLEELAKKQFRATDFLFLGRGIHYPIALEGALKLKEISYIHAEGYPAGEMKHGPNALIDGNLPVVVIATHDPARPDSRVQYEKTLSNIKEVKAREGIVIALANRGDRQVRDAVDYMIELPPAEELLLPILEVVPLQLLAYHIAVRRGCDVDQPRNLAKSVTVE